MCTQWGTGTSTVTTSDSAGNTSSSSSQYKTCVAVMCGGFGGGGFGGVSWERPDYCDRHPNSPQCGGGGPAGGGGNPEPPVTPEEPGQDPPGSNETDDDDEEGGRAKVEPPSYLETLVPVYGPAIVASNEFKTGNWGWGIVYAVIAGSDVFLVKAAATGAIRGAWKLGSHSWPATRAWLARTRGWAPGIHGHHWWSYQSSSFGTRFPQFTNQPWNLIPLRPEIHYAIHGYGPLASQFGPLQRLWYGTPHWAQAGAISISGHGLALFDDR